MLGTEREAGLGGSRAGCLTRWARDMQQATSRKRPRNEGESAGQDSVGDSRCCELSCSLGEASGKTGYREEAERAVGDARLEAA